MPDDSMFAASDAAPDVATEPQKRGTDAASGDGGDDLLSTIRGEADRLGIDPESGEQRAVEPETHGKAPAEEPDALAGLDETLANLKFDPNDPAIKALPPQARQALADLGQQWLQNHYGPAAQQVSAWAQQIETQSQQLSQFAGSYEYQLAAWLAQNPQQMQAIQSYYAGQNGSGAPQLPQIDPEQLTDQERNLWAYTQNVTENARQLQTQNEQFQQQMQAVMDYQAQLYDWANGYSQYTQTERKAESTRQLTSQWEAAFQTVTNELGFDPLEYGEQFDKAVQLVTKDIAGERALFEANGGRGMPPNLDLTQLLRDALQRAGYDKIGRQREKQARTAPRAPTSRIAGATTGPQDLMETVHEAMAELGVNT